LANKTIVVIVLTLVILAGVGGGILLTQKNADQILRVKAFDLLLPISALGPGWGEISSAHDGWANLPGVIHSPPRPNNAAYLDCWGNMSANQTAHHELREWIVVFNSAREASDWLHLQFRPPLNMTFQLNSTDEGWLFLGLYPGGTFQESALRIKNVAVFAMVSISSTAPLHPSEGWFKALLDAQINTIISAPIDLAWNARPPSRLMISWDDINRTEPNVWMLTNYYGTNGSYQESYRNGWGASETDLILRLTQNASIEEAIHEFELHIDHNDTNHRTLGIGDQSYYWSDIFSLNQASLGEVVVRKGAYLFDIRWVLNEQGSASANETQLAITLATLQVSRLP
jgi:hypothetical protein